MATPEEAAIDKMKAFIAGGACGNELSVGLYDRLLEVAGRVPVTNLPSATNNTLTGKAFRRCANKMVEVTKDDIELLADWLEEEYPVAAVSFTKDLVVVGFSSPANMALVARPDMPSGSQPPADLVAQLADEMNACAIKQMLPNGAACAALSFALYAGRLPTVDGNGLAFGSEVRMSGEYKVLCKLAIDNLKMAMDKGTNIALNAYFDGLMEQLQDSGQPSMQSRLAVWYQNARTTFPDIESRIEYIKAYLNKHQGKGLPETIDLPLVMRFKVMRAEESNSRDPPRKSEEDASEVKELLKKLESMRQSVDDLRSANARLKSRKDEGDDPPKKCGYCGKTNHTEKQCLFKRADKKKALKASEADAEPSAQDDE
tara:strand:+ start:198 stop:1313 length:1116 start_codon:yes stop_codon:yes gene_type:complete